MLGYGADGRISRLGESTVATRTVIDNGQLVLVR